MKADATVARAIEENEFEFFSSMGRLSGVRLLDLRGAVLLDTGRYDFVRVLSSRLAPEDVDDVIAQARAAVTEGASPLQWVTGGGNRPEDLPDHLVASGFELAGSMPAMAAPIASLPAWRSLGPPGLSIARVQSEDELRERYAPVLEAHFGRDSKFLAAIIGSYEADGFGPDARFCHFVGRVGDGEVEVVGTGLLAAGVIGIHTVATLKASRGRGLGSAMTAAVAASGFGSGVELAVLHATAMGFPVYRRLGFETHFEVTFYRDSVPASS